MKLHKLISRTVLATALLGATFGGVFSGINANAQDPSQNSSDSQGNNTVSNGYQGSDNSSSLKNGSDDTVSKGFKNNNNTQVQITDGYLNLDSTPQFNFGTNKNAVQQNPNNTGNVLNLSNTGSLQVTDYRASSNNSNTDNWDLYVSVDPFNISNSVSNPSNNTHSQDWYVGFTSNNSNKSDKNVPTYLNPTSIQSNDSSKKVINGGYGSTQIQFNNDMAQLHVPYNVQPANYTTSMDWTLSTKISSDINDSPGT